MKSLGEIRACRCLAIEEVAEDGGYGMIWLPGTKQPAMVVFSWGGGWDHVSVSYRDRCCTWEEMCIIKRMFFRDDECVVQYHPPKEDYVNNHPFCLHLWRPQHQEILMPPKEFV